MSSSKAPFFGVRNLNLPGVYRSNREPTGAILERCAHLRWIHLGFAVKGGSVVHITSCKARQEFGVCIQKSTHPTRIPTLTSVLDNFHHTHLDVLVGFQAFVGKMILWSYLLSGWKSTNHHCWKEWRLCFMKSCHLFRVQAVIFH